MRIDFGIRAASSVRFMEILYEERGRPLIRLFGCHIFEFFKHCVRPQSRRRRLGLLSS